MQEYASANEAESSRIFDVIPENSELDTLVSNYLVRRRLYRDLRTNIFENESPTSDSYYVLMKISFLYSAIEALNKIFGKDAIRIELPELAEEMRTNTLWRGFTNTLRSVIESKDISEKLSALCDSGSSDDFVPLLAAVRHSFFHPLLTAHGSTLPVRPELRRFLLRVGESANLALIEQFDAWARQVARWSELVNSGDDADMDEGKTIGVAAGYPKLAIEREFGVELSDFQWGILIEELWGDEDDSVEVIIADVVGNIGSYESEYKDWAAKVEEAQKRKQAEP